MKKKVAVCGPRDISKKDLINCRNLGSKLMFNLGPGWELITGGASGASGEVVANCYAGDHRKKIAYVPFSNKREYDAFTKLWEKRCEELNYDSYNEVWKKKTTGEAVEEYPVCPFHERSFYDKIVYTPRIKTTGSLEGDIRKKAMQRIEPMIRASNSVVGFINPQTGNTWKEMELATRLCIPTALLVPKRYSSDREIRRNIDRLNGDSTGEFGVYQNPEAVAEFLREFYRGGN